MFSFLGVKTFFEHKCKYDLCARNVFTKPDINFFPIKTKYLTLITINKQCVNNRKKEMIRKYDISLFYLKYVSFNVCFRILNKLIVIITKRSDWEWIDKKDKKTLFCQQYFSFYITNHVFGSLIDLIRSIATV